MPWEDLETEIATLFAEHSGGGGSGRHEDALLWWQHQKLGQEALTARWRRSRPARTQCAHCRTLFAPLPKGPVRKFCSRSCKDASYRARTRSASQTCAHCGLTFGTRRRQDARYCTTSCQYKAYRRRRQATAQAAPPTLEDTRRAL